MSSNVKWQWLMATHAMVDGGDLDGLAPNLNPVYSAERLGFKGQMVYRKLTNGGLFVPPGDEIGQMIQVSGIYISVGDTGLAGVTYKAEMVPLAKAAGGGIALGGGDAGPSTVIKHSSVAGFDGIVLGLHEAFILPPHYGIKITTQGVGVGEQVAATVMFEKWRDAVASHNM